VEAGIKRKGKRRACGYLGAQMSQFSKQLLQKFHGIQIYIIFRHNFTIIVSIVVFLMGHGHNGSISTSVTKLQVQVR
jgi:hypothetical protein